MAEDSDASRRFTSWKMDWINALMIAVDSRDFRIAVCLLQHANRDTKLINPAQARIAKLLDCSVATVERAVARLVGCGWIETVRTNRQRSNHYRFVEAKRMATIDLRQAREDEWAETRRTRPGPDPAELRAQELADPAEVMAPEPSEVRGPDPAELRGKHLKGTPVGNTLILGHDKKGTEHSIGQYASNDVGGEGLAQLATQQAKQASPSGTGPSGDDSFHPVGSYVEPQAIFDRIAASAKWRGE